MQTLTEAASPTTGATPAGGVALGASRDDDARPREVRPPADPLEGSNGKVSSQPVVGMVPICLRWAPIERWKQRTLWVVPTCDSDDLKWFFRSHLMSSVSTWRVHDGFGGKPNDSDM